MRLGDPGVIGSERIGGSEKNFFEICTWAIETQTQLHGRQPSNRVEDHMLSFQKYLSRVQHNCINKDLTSILNKYLISTVCLMSVFEKLLLMLVLYFMESILF